MIALIAGAFWLFSLAVVLGGYLGLLTFLSIAILRRTNVKHLATMSIVALVISLPLAWLLVHMLVSGLSASRLYTFTAFTKILWNPLMPAWALIAAILYAAAYFLRARKAAFLFFGQMALVCLYAGTGHAFAGLFFGNDILRAYGIELHY